MKGLKKLLKLELIGWLLIALAAFNVCTISFKWGVLCILIGKLCCALSLGCKWCLNSKASCGVKK
jgi:hypothetical protein